MLKQNQIAVIQARMGSSRLPGKMLKTLARRPLIDYPLGRLCAFLKPEGLLDSVVLATSTTLNNDLLVRHVSDKWPQVVIVRGPEEDVLSRFISAIRETSTAVVVRVTGDCPLINIDAMQKMLEALCETGADVVNYQPGYEYIDKGLEVISAEALLRVAEDKELKPRDREHVTSLMYRCQNRYKVRYIESEPYLRRGDIRLTVDTHEDLQFFEALFNKLPEETNLIRLKKVVDILNEFPEICNINERSGRKSTSHERARLGFRCDGGTDIGLGHVVGSLRLAILLARELGIGVEFVVRDEPATLSLVKSAGFAIEVLPNDISPENDISRLIQKAGESDWAGIVFNFSKNDLERYASLFGSVKKAHIALIFMDNPLPPSWELGDVLINSLPHPNYAGYNPKQHKACFDGLGYFILNAEYKRLREQPRVFSPRVARVLVSMGGGDSSNATLLVLQGLRKAGFNGYVDVVLGAANLHEQEVRAYFQDNGFTGEINRACNNMAMRIVKADIGFSSLGLTTYEMAALGLPVLIVAGTSFNAGVAQQYAKRYEAAICIGGKKSVTPEVITDEFQSLLKDPERRKQMGKAGKVIGSKTNRVLQTINASLVRN